MVAAVAAASLMVIGARLSDARTVVLAGGFTIMSVLLAIHGLTTPGVLVGFNGVVALTGGATVTVDPAPVRMRVRALMVRLAQKDTSTEEHSRRVAVLAVEIGEQLGLTATRLRALAVGDLLHDIGKLSVPDTILQKPGPLEAVEFDIVKQHPERGAELLIELGGFDESVVRLVRGHHERLDGSGYPLHLDGDDLDLETRILAVCDVYDALVSSRVYRAAWPQNRALSVLQESATEFDPRCVAALAALLAVERDTQLAPVEQRHKDSVVVRINPSVY